MRHALFLCGFLSQLLASCTLNAEQPNIVFLLADDQCTYSVGCYGNPDVKTPEMDRLARDGFVFDRHYNTTAICMASRASIFTGKYEYKTGCNFTHGDMKPEVWEQSYPVLLRQAGYTTAFAGKFGIAVEGKGLCESDFDSWGGGKGQTHYKTSKNPSMAKYAKRYPHSTLSYAAFAEDFIRAAAQQDEPFCLSISFKAPHKPATPDPRFDHVYKGYRFKKPANFGRQFGEHLSPQSKMGRQYPRFTDWKYDRDYDGEMAKYHQQIYGIDHALGMIRKSLASHGVDDNTVVIYTSDNGYICGSHGYGSKVLPMEESSRVPLIVFDPRNQQSAGLRCSQLTGNIDLGPTMLDFAGVDIPDDVDGVSLKPLFESPNVAVREQLAFINVYGPIATTSLSCITRNHKYTYWWFSNDEMKPVEELFELSTDPLELINLANRPEHESLRAEMRSRYDTELASWKNNAVDYNDYQCFGQLFERQTTGR
ncbi:MAG: sulfatase [Planctomycetota bacterium]